ncbi:MAG: DUF1569 domain-containing protein [Terracidiphilus sp.]|jgi:hypothetical protein
MKTLRNATDKAEIVRRLAAVGPASERRWGRMSVGEMVCHLSDALQAAMGARKTSSRCNWFTRSLMKWVGLWGPIVWPHGVKTVPECEAGKGGTKPAEMESDLRTVRELLEGFAALPPTFAFPEHAIFGRMTYTEWMRWGYLHMDHHLRQFGA